MATEYQVTDGNLVETETATTSTEYSLNKINRAISNLQAMIADRQAELAIWEERLTQYIDLTG